MQRHLTPSVLAIVAACGGLAACGDDDKKATTTTTPAAVLPVSTLTASPTKDTVGTLRPGEFVASTALNLKADGPDSAIIEAIGLRDTASGLVSLGVRAVRVADGAGGTLAGKDFDDVWPPKDGAVRGVEGLVIQPAAGEDGPYDVTFGFQVTKPGRLRAGTAIVYYRQGTQRKMARVPLKLTVTSKKPKQRKQAS